MEASEPVAASDLYGHPIRVGSWVRYVTTRTLGKVKDLKKEEGRTWALLDSTGLFYDTHYLTVTEERHATEEDDDSVKVDISEVEKKIKDMEEALKITDVTVTDSSCEGGG